MGLGDDIRQKETHAIDYMRDSLSADLVALEDRFKVALEEACARFREDKTSDQVQARIEDMVNMKNEEARMRASEHLDALQAKVESAQNALFVMQTKHSDLSENMLIDREATDKLRNDTTELRVS